MVRLLKPTLRRLSTAVAKPAPKVKDAHYYTPEHRDWAKRVLAAAGHICQSCGRYGCRLYADHIVELRDGGAPFALSNGQALCGSCHTTKTTRARAARQAKPQDVAGGGRV
jgi:5-methylcytosine-specific restriction protein A